jgi:hypothetical protein
MPDSLTPTTIALIAAGAIILVTYVWFVVAPAWASYGRVWEKIAATFLTLYILAALLGVGAAIGFMIVWSYDRWA